MDRARIYRNIYLIISLIWIRMSEISSKEYYCTKAGTWREAMTSCTRSGGVPLSYRDLYNSTAFTLKDNRTVWTADYIYLEYMTGIAQGKTTEGYECGYLTFKFEYEWFERRYNYFQHSGIKYDKCTSSKLFMCNDSTVLQLVEVLLNWDKAYSYCPSDISTTLLDRYNFSLKRKLIKNEIWIRRKRRFTQGTVNGTINIGEKSIETCGTNVEEVKRYKHNCEELLESVCVFDDTVQETDNLTRACFEDQTTEVYVNVTRWPFAGSTIVTSADPYDNKTSKEHTGQVGDYIAIVVATVIAVCCILIGIGLFCYWNKRRKIDEKNTTVRYVNENLSSTTTGRNTYDTNGSVNDRANAVDIADEYYEACDAPRDINSVDDVYTTTEQHGEYGNVYSACRSEKRSENPHNAATISNKESEYDSTRNIKEYENSSNIYNSLGFEGVESVYDSAQYDTDKGVHVDSSTYSSCSVQDNTYNTTAGLNGSRQNHGLLPSHDNVYSISSHDTNQHDKTYGNIGKVNQTAGGSSIYDTAYHNGT